MNYINAKNLSPTGYERATVETEYGNYCDYQTNAKSFFHSKLFHGQIDHGNHYNTSNFYLSSLCLIHYHCRNLNQMKKILWVDLDLNVYNADI